MKDVEPPLVADREPLELVEPCEAAFDHPPMAAEFLTGLDATSGDAGLNLSVQASSATKSVIIGFVGVQLVRPTAWASTFSRDGRGGVEQVFKWHTVVDVGPGQEERERDAAPVCDQMPLGARFTSIRGVRACRGAPF